MDDFIGKSVPTLTHWEDLDINYHHIAKINQDKCIHCGLCYIACEDASHQSINLELWQTLQHVHRKRRRMCWL